MISSSTKKIYFMGIGGTGMAAAAGLTKELGYEVLGSDHNLYPPMSTLLEELKIPVLSPYDPENVTEATPDLLVIANVLSRGHKELEAGLNAGIPYTSFPALLSELILKKRHAIVVSGTHGKTTTTSLLSHVLHELETDPSFVVGGIPQNFPRSFRLGSGPFVAIEGDEYDTAFFDKGPKFLHYCPKTLIINNIEFDHADIYPNLDAIKDRFKQLIRLVEVPKLIIANGDDHHTIDCLSAEGVGNQATLISLKADHPTAQIKLVGSHHVPRQDRVWRVSFETRLFGKVTLDTNLSGFHNLYNMGHVLGVIHQLVDQKALAAPSPKRLSQAFFSFKGVKRRLEHLGTVASITVFEDFAHHPTAVASVIEGCRRDDPNKRILVAFEPKNATSRRNIFQDQYVKSLGKADQVFIGACPDDKRIGEGDKMNTSKLAHEIGSTARSFETNEDLLESLIHQASPEDIIVFMSSGSFSGIQHKTIERLEEKFSSLKNRKT